MSWTQQPLTDAEREEFQKLFRARLSKVEQKTADAFAFRKVDTPPFMVNSSFYHLFGIDPDLVAPDYFDTPAAMTRFQERTLYEQVKAVDDDFVPCLVPWFGCVVMASALGCSVQIPRGMDP